MMTMRCVIERDTTAGTNSAGYEQTPTWTTLASGVPCRMWDDERTSRSDQDGRVRTFYSDRKVILALDTDVTDEDRIGDVTDRRGNTLFTGPARVDEIRRRHDHIELRLREVV